MTTPIGMSHRPRSVPLRTRLQVRLASGLAAVLARTSPHRIKTVLIGLRSGARPATAEFTEWARETVVTVSLPCAAREGCLRRSLAVVLLARMRGRWPTWQVGVKVLPPFTAHAWVEAEGQLIGEGLPAGYFHVLISVPPKE